MYILPSYPACKSHISLSISCYTYPLPGSSVFLVDISGRRRGNSPFANKCLFLFYLQLLPETFLSPRIQRYIVINWRRSLSKLSDLLSYFNYLVIILLYSEHNFSPKSFQREPTWCIRTDERKEENWRSLSCCKLTRTALTLRVMAQRNVRLFDIYKLEQR
jgi:hypothetical protein